MAVLVVNSMSPADSRRATLAVHHAPPPLTTGQVLGQLAPHTGAPPLPQHSGLLARPSAISTPRSELAFAPTTAGTTKAQVLRSTGLVAIAAGLLLAAVAGLRHPRPAATAMAAMSSLKVEYAAGRPRSALQAQNAPSVAADPFSNIRGDDPVSSIMTKMPLVTVLPEAPIEDALQLLVQHDLAGLPVVDANNKFLGMVSDVDLLSLETFLEFGRAQDVFPKTGESYNTFKELKQLALKQSRRTVGEVMMHPTTVSPADTIKKADRLLLLQKLPRLPVIDDEGRLLGIISRKRIMAFVYASMGTPVVREVGRPQAQDLRGLSPEDPVSLFMKERQVQVTPQTPVDEAYRQMIGRRIRGLVVVDDKGTVVGVASDYDLLAVDLIDNFKSRTNDAFPKPSEPFAQFRDMQEMLRKHSASTVGELMTPNPYLVRDTASFAEALQIFADKKVARLPVINSDGKCVGVLTIIRAITALTLMRQAQPSA
eukprot:EG_transcript_8954